jgi:hypothetical protein
MAIASLVFGIFFIFFPLSIPAIVFGHIALSQIKRSAGRLGGRGLAIAGLVMGYLGIAMIPLIPDYRRDCDSQSAASTDRGERGFDGNYGPEYQHRASDLSGHLSGNWLRERFGVPGRSRTLHPQPSDGLPC